jgi:hypothetical protein
MYPLTRFFNYLKRIDFSLALEREHISDRDLTEWYPYWLYELMETDEVRNKPYQEAIREAVSGKVVLELGTGRKALWAVCCARAGAKRVYAIEANERAYQASLRFLRSEGIENVHLICGFSDKVEVPERCEVLVHDLVGDIGSSEGMISFIEDAKRRLLTPDAIHIPQSCTTHVVLVEDPRLGLAEWLFSYAMRGFRRFEDITFVRFFGFPKAAVVSKVQMVEDFIFNRALPFSTSSRLDFEIDRDAELRGALFFIRLYFGDKRIVDTWNSNTTWATPYVRLKAPATVKKGDIVEMSIQSELSGNPRYSLQIVHKANGSAREIGRYDWTGD